jgi:hypothetical protein
MIKIGKREEKKKVIKSRKVKYHQSRLKAHRYLVKAIGREMANAFRQLEERSYRGTGELLQKL